MRITFNVIVVTNDNKVSGMTIISARQKMQVKVKATNKRGGNDYMNLKQIQTFYIKTKRTKENETSTSRIEDV
jgi:hypothetical protein